MSTLVDFVFAAVIFIVVVAVAFGVLMALAGKIADYDDKRD